MVYNDFQGMKLSALGMGNMRLPVIGGNDGEIDVEKSREMIAYCMDHGINYYDTAYGYHGGNSELMVGELLQNYSRDSFYLASNIAPMALASVDADKQPECCINCHSCEKVCPQTIHIPDELKKFAGKMGRA